MKFTITINGSWLSPPTGENQAWLKAYAQGMGQRLISVANSAPQGIDCMVTCCQALVGEQLAECENGEMPPPNGKEPDQGVAADPEL